MSAGVGSGETDAFARSVDGLRVALVHDWLTGMRGGEKVLEEIAALFPGAPIVTLFHFRDRISSAINAHEIRTSWLQTRFSQGFLRRRYRWLLPLFPFAIGRFDFSGYDLVISTSHCVAKSVVTPRGTPHFCYCHTPMRYVWDQRDEYFPGWKGVVLRPILAPLRWWDRWTASRVNVFWANSTFVRERIRRFYRGRYDGPVEVLSPPVDVDRFATPEELERAAGLDGRSPDDVVACSNDSLQDADPYAITVSALVPYKRVDLAVEACNRLGLRLLVVGEGSERRRLEELAGPRTELLGFVEGERLRELMRGARLFLQPGVEDFGISSVEALAAGTPVVARGRGGICDIVDQDVHGVLYGGASDAATSDGAASVDDLAAAIDRALKLRFNRLELLRRARTFSRDRFIDELKASISRHLASGQEEPPSP